MKLDQFFATNPKTPQFMGVTVCGVDYNGL